MAQIVVPTDFSGVSDEAAQTAFKLAKDTTYEVVFLHLIAVDDKKIIGESDKPEFQRKVMSEVARQSKKLEILIESANQQKVRASRAIKYDKSYQSLLEYISNNEVFMVIMGTHGASGTRELIVGSNSQMIARFSPAPVLVVKEGYVHKEIKKVAFVSDFNKPPSPGFEKALDIARKLELDMHLLFINTPDDFVNDQELYEKMEAYVTESDHYVSQKESFNALEIEGGLSEYCKTHDIDAICMVTHERQGTSTISRSSLTEKLINHMRFPVLCLHD